MIIKEGTKLEIKGVVGGRWKPFIASDDFNLADERWKLYDPSEKEGFEPLGSRCKIKIVFPDGRKKLIGRKNGKM